MNLQYPIPTSLQSDLIERIRQLSSPMKPYPTEVAEWLTTLPGIRAVLFDIYGTLFISGTGDISIAHAMSNEHALAEALQFAGYSGDLDQAGSVGIKYLLQAIQHSHAARRKVGIESPEVDIRREWKTVLSQLQKDQLLHGDITAETVARLSVDYECRVNPVWPMPTLVETLTMLKKSGLILGIVSNAQFYTQLLFPAFLEKSYEGLGFQPELCAWSFHLLEAKPSLNLFRGVVDWLRQHHGISPGEILYVGNDMLNDIWSVAQLGLKTTLFAGDQRSLRLRENDERCLTLKPDVIITNLAQLSQVLK